MGALARTKIRSTGQSMHGGEGGVVLGGGGVGEGGGERNRRRCLEGGSAVNGDYRYLSVICDIDKGYIIHQTDR